jgi:putative ABC transport system permease protein
MTLIGLSVSSLRHRLFRNILTASAVTLAIGILTVTLTAVNKIYRLMHALQGSPILSIKPLLPRDSTRTDLPISYINQIRKVPGVRDVDWMHFLAGSDDRFNYDIQAHSANRFDNTAPMALRVDPETLQRWKDDRQGAVLSTHVMEHFHKQVGELLSLNTRLGLVQARVSGIVTGEFAATPIVFLHYEAVEELQGKNDRGTAALFAHCDSNQDIHVVAQAIDAQLESTPIPTMTVPSEETFAAMAEQSGAIPDLLYRVGLLIFGVSFLIAGTTLAMSLRERRSDFGVLRALGYTQRLLFGLILLESMSVTALGGILGALVPFVLYHKQGLTLGPLGLTNVQITPETCLLGIVAASLLGLGVAIGPAVRTLREQITSALENG